MQATLDQLAVATTITEHVISAIGESSWDEPTPCADWNVRDLVLHLVAGNDAFAAALQPDDVAAATQGAETQGAETQDAGTQDAGATPADGALLTSYQQSAQNLLDAFRRPGALDQTITIPFGTLPAAVALHPRITDLLVHAWDLARATGQQVAFPADLAEQELAFSRKALASIAPERRPFSAAQPVADDAPAIDRLAAYLGRTVNA